jgi:hypothetical protein
MVYEMVAEERSRVALLLLYAVYIFPLSTLEKGKPLERVGRKASGLRFHR